MVRTNLTERWSKPAAFGVRTTAKLFETRMLASPGFGGWDDLCKCSSGDRRLCPASPPPLFRLSVPNQGFFSWDLLTVLLSAVISLLSLVREAWISLRALRPSTVLRLGAQTTVAQEDAKSCLPVVWAVVLTTARGRESREPTLLLPPAHI